MTALVGRFATFGKIKHFRSTLLLQCRYSNTLTNDVIEKHRKSKLTIDHEPSEPETSELETPTKAPRDYKFVYPDFLPDPDWRHRDRIKEKLEHSDMLLRRNIFKIPEFYVGCIMAVTASDQYAPGKKNRFVGICIERSHYGLASRFTLRNVVDGQGLEITYELYNPTIMKVDVLKLEKRLDDCLYYLRDAPPECSTIPFDFESVPHPPGAPVPINPIKVKLKPRPWHERWERQDLKGLEDLNLAERFYKRAEEVATPWDKHDLMKQYRSSINEDEAAQIMDRIYDKMQEIEQKHGKAKKTMES